jgi:glycosyltransferase involved in cell wall biosynthesis
MDKTGLGNQTRNLAYMLKPYKILAINSSGFTKNAKQYPENYSNFNAFTTRAWPTNSDVRAFLRNIDVLFTCETFYNPIFLTEAKRLGIKTVIQFNYEFLDNLNVPNYPKADVYLCPSYWHVNDLAKIGIYGVKYLPPPTDHRLFTATREKNMSTHGKRFLHIIGKKAMYDRNGTSDLIEALEQTDSEFELMIKSQDPTDANFYGNLHDHRIRFDFNQPVDESELYAGFDALIMPRRYGGLCLPMNEALISGLPVIMSDVNPNNKILPKKWLVEATQVDNFLARAPIEVYSTDAKALAAKIDWLCEADLSIEKAEAFELGYNNYSVDTLLPAYKEILEL